MIQQFNYGSDSNQKFIILNDVLIRYIGEDTNVWIPSGVREISATAFSQGHVISSIHIPDSVVSISRYAFASCTALKRITIGFGVELIPIGCFSELHALESVTLTDCIRSIDDYAFYHCVSLREISFLTKKYRDPITPAEKGKAFERMLSGQSAKIECVETTDSVPALSRIGNYAFAGCKWLNSDALEVAATVIGMFAFDEKQEVTAIAIPASEQQACYVEEEMVDEIVNSEESVPNEEAAALSHESLIEGFFVEDGVIYHEKSNQIVEDAPISILNLSTRANNCLNRIGEPPLRKKSKVMISEVLLYTPTELRDIRSMGTKTIDEIIEKIEQYLAAHSKDKSVNLVQPINTLAPAYEVVEGIITNMKNQRVVPDITLDRVNLSVRATNSLFSVQIRRLSELIPLSEQQLHNFSSMSEKTIKEIARFVPAYLQANEVDSICSEVGTSDNINTSTVYILPEVDESVPVLAEEYAVVRGAIFNRKTNVQIADSSIEVLDLSVRARNCLEKSGLTTISSLVGLPYDQFREIRNLGIRSANEIQEQLELYLSRWRLTAESEASQGAIISSSDVLCFFKENEYESLSLDAICEAFPDVSEEDILQLVEYLLQEGSIESNGEQYNIYHRSFFDSLLSLAKDANIDERALTVLQMRMNGTTLEEVGQHFRISRERIRQIEKKAMERITRRGQIHFKEDKFAYFFTTYAIDKEVFFQYLNESEQLWYYLNTRYNRGKEELSAALNDQKVSVELRRATDRYIHRACIYVDGLYIPRQRGDLEDYVVEKYCKEEVSLEEFFARYEAFLQECELDDERFQLSDSVRATRINRLSESNKLLWKQNQRLRYYDIQSGDYSELLEVLNLGQYADIELSTRKFLQDYPELMARYDLRDEYEVHNLLKKIHAETENENLTFCRMPNIIFGSFDRDAAVKEILFALAPVSQDDLIDAISQSYGTRGETIKANWLQGISEYYHQGMYFIDYEDMPEDHIQKLQTVLTEDFYFLTELRKIYSQTVPDADMSLLSTYNLKKMGFLVGSSYVLQHYPTAEAFFDYLLTTADVVDVAPISKRYTGLSSYSLHLADLRREMQIIEFEPYQYINIRRLERLGFDKPRLRAYADRVWSFLVDDEYFTIQSLRNAGFEDELDVLGFGDLFYSSLLREDPRFTWQRVGKTVVLNPQCTQFTVHDFLVDRVTKEVSIDVDDFIAMLQDVYGIVFERHKVFEHVRGSDVYYDAIMGKLYADYETYFEEV